MELIIASQNINKLKEIQNKLPENIKLIGLKDLGFTEELPETGKTIKENALQKARFIYQKFGKDCFADDTGLEIELLNGKPGVDSAHYAGAERDANKNMDLVLDQLKGSTNRNARFVTVFAIIIDGKEYLAEGSVSGKIGTEKIGAGGFGYDPIFYPENQSITFAQMSLEEKNALSHRARALNKMVELLKTL